MVNVVVKRVPAKEEWELYKVCTKPTIHKVMSPGMGTFSYLENSLFSKVLILPYGGGGVGWGNGIIIKNSSDMPEVIAITEILRVLRIQKLNGRASNPEDIHHMIFALPYGTL